MKTELEYQLIRSDRKTVSLQITPDAKLVVRAPKSMPQSRIRELIESKYDWITTHIEKARLAEKEPAEPAFTKEDIFRFADDALKIIPGRVAYYAKLMGVDYGRITVRNQKTRWGSCSSDGNLNFNCLLSAVPPDVLDYVVVHELAHRKEMNHSKKFWAIVEAQIPDYRIKRKWLKENGGELIRRMIR